MRAVWVLAGVGVAVAAGAAMVVAPASPHDDASSETTAQGASASLGHSTGGRQRVPTKYTPRSMTGGPARDPFAGMSGWEGGMKRAGDPIRTLDKPKPFGAPNAPNQVITSGAQAPEGARKAAIDGRGPGGPAATSNVANQRGAQAQRSTTQQAEIERKRQQLEQDRRQRLAEAQRRGGGGAAGGVSSNQARAAMESAQASSASSNDPFANFDPNAPPSMDQIQALARAFGVDLGAGTGPGSRGGSSSGSSGSGPGSTPGRTGPGGGGGGGGGTNNNPQTTDGTGGSSGSTGTPDVTVRWFPIDNRSCGTTLAGFRTNDLFLRLSNNTPVTAIDSASGNGLALSGGTFHQHPAGTNVNPTAEAVATSSCVLFDSFLNDFGVINPTSLGLVFSDRLVASWLNFAGVVGEQNSARFGDTAFYVYLGRFTAPTNITNFAGLLTVGVGIPGVNFTTRNVNVGFDSNLWRDNANFNTPGSGTPGGGTPPGGTNPPGGDTGTQPGDPAITMVWLPINNNGCTETVEDLDTGDPLELSLTDFRTADLYIRSGTVFSVQFAASFDDTMPPEGPTRAAVGVTGGTFFQHPYVFMLTKPSAGTINEFPCAAFDSFIAIDTPQTPAHRGVTLITAPGSGWTDAIRDVAWFAPTSETAVTAPGLFPSDASGFYVRVARITVSKDAVVSGTLDVGIVRFGSTAVTVLTLPACPTCWD